MLNSVFRYQAKSYSTTDKSFGEKAAKSFHVDEFYTSVNSFEVGEILLSKMKPQFLEASFNVRNWKTNGGMLQNYFDKMEPEISPNIHVQNIENTKFSSLVQRAASEQFILSFDDLVEIYKVFPTKGNILSLIAAFCDLLEFIYFSL